MSDPNHVSRRQLLGLGAGAASLGVAGCVFDSPALASESVFEDVRVDEQDLVVDLVDGHDVSKLNLIGPDGTLFRSSDVAEGSTKARIPIIDIDAIDDADRHYPVGTSELVAVRRESNETFDVELRPELRVVGISQYRDGDGNLDRGKIRVSIENQGSGPSWIYDISYRDAPAEATNTNLVNKDAEPLLLVPDGKSGYVVSPGEVQNFVGVTSPLLFDENQDENCAGTFEMEVLAGVAHGDVLKERIRISLGGIPKSAGGTGKHSCSNVEIVRLTDT